MIAEIPDVSSGSVLDSVIPSSRVLFPTRWAMSLSSCASPISKMRAQVAKITVQQRKGVIYLES
eukprot:gene34802-39347_t